MMRWRELMVEAEPTGGTGGVKPLTPTMARNRKQKQDKASAHVRDVEAANAVRIGAAQRKAADI
jgi:hypothetical protein